jgi:hypothetical protein
MEANLKAKGGRRKAVGAEKALLELFGRLASGQQGKLLAFAEFLAAQAPAAGNGKPAVIPRPGRETVTMAIRRLVQSYPMLDRKHLMAEASPLMAQHALEGRAASEVIDDLEAVFARHYEQQKSKGESRKAKV